MDRLRVLIANERQDRLADVAALVASLGHEVIAPQLERMLRARTETDEIV